MGFYFYKRFSAASHQVKRFIFRHACSEFRMKVFNMFGILRQISGNYNNLLLYRAIQVIQRMLQRIKHKLAVSKLTISPKVRNIIKFDFHY